MMGRGRICGKGSAPTGAAHYLASEVSLPVSPLVSPHSLLLHSQMPEQLEIQSIGYDTEQCNEQVYHKLSNSHFYSILEVSSLKKKTLNIKILIK